MPIPVVIYWLRSAELERLRLQARVWEPEAEALLDRMACKRDGAVLI